MIEEILVNLDFQVNHNNNWVEPLGLDRDTWKILLNYITYLREENDRLLMELNKNMIERNNFLSIINKVLELLENDYFEDGSFENYYEVMNLLRSVDNE